MAQQAESHANSAAITLTSAQAFQGNDVQTDALARTQSAYDDAAAHAAAAR
jgi:hypothetical protein